MILDQHELKRRMILRLKSMDSGRLLIGPERVHLRLTDLCNLTCQYCWYYGSNSTQIPSGKNHFPFEVFKDVLRDCGELQVDNIELSGIGDPALHPRFYDMLQCLERSFSTILYTNGTFPIDRCRDILRTDHIVINLGAADKESYRALQGKDLFMRVVRNIKELARIRPQVNPKFRLEVVFVETNMNTENFSRTEKLVKRLGADHVRRSKFEPSEHNYHLKLTEPQEIKASVGGWPSCFHGWFDSAIRINGDVNVCAFSKQLTIGNVQKNSFKDIWGSEEYARARGLALTGADPFGNSQGCKNCRATFRNKEIGTKVEIYNRSQKA